MTATNVALKGTAALQTRFVVIAPVAILILVKNAQRVLVNPPATLNFVRYVTAAATVNQNATQYVKLV
jgi:hypothetical protein